MAIALSAFLFAGSVPSQAQTGVVQLNSPGQTIAGFGAASAWSGTMSSAQAQAMFGTLGFSLWRVRIDPGGNNSAEAGNVSAAHSYGAKVLATPWTPPASMKSNGSTIGGSLNPGSYGAYASYLNSSMSQLGADYVSIQNEPDFLPGTYESCSWTPQQLETFLDQQGANIQHPIVMPESAGFNTNYSDPSLNDSGAVGHIYAVGGHLYGASPFYYTNAINHGKQVWMTEHYLGSGPDINDAMSVAKEINDCMDNSFSAYIWWWAYYPGNSTNLLNGSTILLTGYVMGQYARFVRPGYVRVNATYNPQGNVYLSAYTGGGNVVVVAVNTSTSAVNQTISFTGGTAPSTMTPYRTSSSQSIVQLSNVGLSNGSFTYTLPGQSVTTFVGAAASGIANGTYEIINHASGLALDAFGRGTTNGTRVDQWGYSGGTNQQWNVSSIGGGLYSIVGVQSGLSLDVYGDSSANGAEIDLWQSNGGSNQKWALNLQADGDYEISPQNAPGSCLDDPNGSTTPGTYIQLWGFWDGPMQEWQLIRLQ